MLAALIRSEGIPLSFTMLEVGSRPIDNRREPFYALLDHFPGSRILAFEPDAALCEDLGRRAPPGVSYHPVALGRRDERRRFYETVHPMCSSLYEPDERFATVFHDLDVMRTARVSELDTIRLDRFREAQDLGPVDFIKIDVQGAELEIFEGGVRTLRDTLCTVCEVEFVPLYRDQPLFGDVDALLRRRGLAFHKFLGLAGRITKAWPSTSGATTSMQQMWADAVFVRDLLSAGTLGDTQLLKLAVLLDLYDSRDVATYLLDAYDHRHGSMLASRYEAAFLPTRFDPGY
jgi:FkbM family methyltransferase